MNAYIAQYNKTRFALVLAVLDTHAQVIQNDGKEFALVSIERKRFDANYTTAATRKDAAQSNMLRFATMLRDTTQRVNADACNALAALSKTLAHVQVNDTLTLRADDTHAANVSAVRETSERAIAAFVSRALSVSVSRIKKDDTRIDDAVRATLHERALIVAALDAVTLKSDDTQSTSTSTSARKSTSKSTSTKTSKSANGGSVKQRIHDYLCSHKRATLDAFVKMFDASVSNVRTALSDLKNPKYAIGGKAIAIEKNEQGEYMLAK
jgi:hypothetical protein